MSCSTNENQVFGEMMVHVPLCTHKEAENVLIIGDSIDSLQEESKKHTGNIECGDLSLLTSKDEKNIDVIVLVNIKLDEMILANIERILKDDGLISFTTTSYQKDADNLKADLKLVGTKFWIAMPFRFNHNTSILASKKYHPTADLILQRSDLIDSLEYYSSDIHRACFVFPANITRDLTGIAKR